MRDYEESTPCPGCGGSSFCFCRQCRTCKANFTQISRLTADRRRDCDACTLKANDGYLRRELVRLGRTDAEIQPTLDLLREHRVVEINVLHDGTVLLSRRVTKGNTTRSQDVPVNAVTARFGSVDGWRLALQAAS